MKVINLILVVATAVFTFSSAKAQEKILPLSEVPAQITSYVETHFPKSEIVSVKKDKEILSTEYDVTLNTKVELDFDKGFAIKKVESKTALPRSVVPKKISDYVLKNYPNNKILEWSKKKKGQKIELDNDIELVFDLNGKFLGIDK